MTGLGFAPDWKLPSNVRAWVTTRAGGLSQGPYAGLNLALHVGDDPAVVAENRQRLLKPFGIQAAWLEQVHGTAVVAADCSQVAVADASVSRTPGLASVVLTADCLPVLFSAADGSAVAAAHAGWRGLLAGVLENTVQAMALPAAEISVWLGPAIGPTAFEVGPEVREAFVAEDAQTAVAFLPSARAGHYLADLYALARLRLQRAGVSAISGGGFCTFNDQRFYSYRRAAQTGRFASLIWLTSVK